MKILCEYTASGPSYVRGGWGRAFKAAGHDFRFWRPETKSIFDAMTEFEPDIFLGTTYGVDRATFKCIAARPQMKVGLFASAWGPYLNDVDLNRYPIVVVTEQEKGLIEKLKRETGRPDFVFIHVTDKYLEGTMGGWREIGVTPLGILNAADILVYYPAPQLPQFKSDVSFCGNYWGYKARNIDRFLLPLCHPSSNLSVKIFGTQRWPVSQYMGAIEDKAVKHIFASATVCPNVSEPHSTELNFDLVERPYKVLSSKGFCVSDYVEEARELFDKSELIMCQTPKEFHETVRYFVAHPEERDPYIAAGHRKVVECHTYFERTSKFMRHFGLQDEALRLEECKKSMMSIEG